MIRRSRRAGRGGDSAAGGAPGPQAAANAIKKDQAQAKARCEAVKYLATVPCHYYPEAEAALIQALRTDRSECVRWEAAHALAQGCCCTKKTIAALKIVVSGSQQDGNPSEMSFRVKVEALNALEHCLSMCGNVGQPQRPELPAPMPQPETIPTPLPQPKRPELPLGEEGTDEQAPSVQQANYYEEIERQPSANVIAGARQLVESSRLSARNDTATAPRRGRSLLEIWRQSDRPDEAAMAEVGEAEGPVRVELPGEAAGQTYGQPTLAPPVPPVTGAGAAGYGETLAGKQPVAPVQGPARRARPTSSEDLHAPMAYGQANVPAYGNAATYPAAAAAPQSGPIGQERRPSLSLPPYQGMESLPVESSGLQALPPLEALPNTVASPGMPGTTAPGQFSTVMGTQGYLYPSTEDRSTFYGQPTQVVQQPEWGNPQRR